MSLAQAAVTHNAALQLLLNEYNTKKTELTAMLTKMDCDREVVMSLSTDMERLQSQLRENSLFSQMIDAERTFSALLQAVDREINACIGREESEGCTGDCTSCGGCKH